MVSLRTVEPCGQLAWLHGRYEPPSPVGVVRPEELSPPVSMLRLSTTYAGVRLASLDMVVCALPSRDLGGWWYGF